MRTQHEKNKETLMEEIEKLCGQPMTNSVAEKLSVYRGALKALCMREKTGRSRKFMRQRKSLCGPRSWTAIPSLSR